MDLVKRAADDPKQLLLIASIAQDPIVATAQTQVSRAEAELAALRERYGPKWPRLIEQVAQTDSAHHSLVEAARSAPSRLGSRLRAATVKETNLPRCRHRAGEGVARIGGEADPVPGHCSGRRIPTARWWILFCRN